MYELVWNGNCDVTMFIFNRNSQLRHLRKERFTYLDGTILSNVNLKELMQVEVDDEFIQDNFIEPQPVKCLSLTTRSSSASRTPLATPLPLNHPGTPGPKEQYCSCVHSHAPGIELANLQDRLCDRKNMPDGHPTQLRQWVIL
ncbi:uncharacterized protein RSE6_07679 [Rhynchosporium secalis]|uniref:Uncharacterized protein n=1 Tax=Rhynchosporium secalis TaxID=38038 RepID=A0A1E1MDM4_RHYSE|nr:uncharacterized protein RSE6_07679 [Rhynchosporium secalis]